MSSSSKRQQTMAKRTREQAVKERRALKQAMKHAAAAERRAKAGDPTLSGQAVDDETSTGLSH